MYSFESSIFLIKIYQQNNSLPKGLITDFISDLKKKQNMIIEGVKRIIRESDCMGPWGRSY